MSVKLNTTITAVVCKLVQVASFCVVQALWLKGLIRFNHIVSDKLDKINYPAWKFRMTNFLQGKGYWDYIDGENEVWLQNVPLRMLLQNRERP